MYLQEKLAALHAVFFTFLCTGARIVCSDVTYIAVYRLVNQYLPEKFGMESPRSTTQA